MSTLGKIFSQQIFVLLSCLNLRRRHNGVVCTRTGLKEAEAITAYLAPELKAESTSVFFRQSSEGLGNRQLGTAGQLWPQHVLRVGAVLSCAIFAPFYRRFSQLAVISSSCLAWM